MPGDAAIRAFEHAASQRPAHACEGNFAPATRAFFPGLLDAAYAGTGQMVLDVACGPGFGTPCAAERGAIARGLDFPTATLAVAGARHPAIGFGTPADRTDALEQAGFTGIGTRMPTGVWRQAGGSLCWPRCDPTARVAAPIGAPAPPAIPAIVADTAGQAAADRDADGLVIPVAAFVASGRKS